MKFSTFVRHCTIINNRLKKLEEKIKTLVDVPDEMSGQRLEMLNMYYDEAITKHAEFEKVLFKLASCEKTVEDYDEDQASTKEDGINTLIVSIRLMVKPYLNIGVRSHDLSNSTTNDGVVNTALRLPRLELKSFNGSPEQWLSFYSLFLASVHKNASISEAEKFQYLQSSLQGEALNLVKNLPITTENYHVAWDILIQRYHNSRKIVTYHINNIIDLPNVNSSSTKSLRTFISHLQENTQALIALKHDVKDNSFLLATLLLRKLDNELRKKFEDSRVDSQKMPMVEEILEFLENECTHMEAAGFPNFSKPNTSSPSSSTNAKNHQFNKHTFQKQPQPRAVLISSSQSHDTSFTCKFCGKTDHVMYRCKAFQDLSPQDKSDFVKKHNYCLNCLGTAHVVKDCRSKNVCFKCGKKHHTWLHVIHKPQFVAASPPTGKEPDAVSKPNSSPGNPRTALGAFSHRPNSTILLGTTLVQVSSANNHSIVIRAVVDSASMVTCISENVGRLLSLERHFNEYSNVDGLSNCQVKTKGMSRINISSLNGTQVAKNHPVILLDKITSNLPHAQVPNDVKNRYQNIVLADPTFGTPSSVDMLIGADLFAKVITGERLIIGDDLPAALNSVFGYILIGAVPVLKPSQDVDCVGITTLLTTQDFNLHQSLTRFWVQEEVSCSVPASPDEIFCENHFMTHHKRDSSGAYMVRLPFKEGHPALGNSSENAKRRFLSLERRLDANPDLKQKYIEGMNDYLESGHMELVTDPIPEDSANFVLPHHGVVKEESSTTKLRIVFDASAHSSSGVSLNQILHSGQKLHNAISDIILIFRCYPIVFSCDIKKMFRQIKMDPRDQNFQLLFWRENSSQPLSVYRLTTLVFGFSSSPYLALRTLKQLVKDEGDKYPVAAKAIEDQLYVDDVILGSNSIEEALNLQKEIIELMSKGGFHLRKFTSNCSELVTNVPESHRENPMYFQNSDNPLYSVLGIKWVAETDNFAYRQRIVESKPTKRNILSIISQIYDPCGWLAPVTFATKSLIQVLWTLGLQWDEQVPTEISEKWNRFISQLPELNKIHIPRYIAIQGAVEVQLHGFSDASEAGFSAVVYIRCISQDSKIEVSLLIAKSRVAPLKRISIPRLELCGAHLLAKLLQYAESIISQHHSINSVSAWTDSSVVLSWLHTPPFRLKVYAANRVAEIQNLTPAHLWNHVSTHDNPADCASRGLLPSLLKNHHLWWNGPPWLKLPQDTWPISRYTLLKEDNLPELKSEPLPVLVNTTQPNNFIHKFSSWMLLLRVMAYVLRFIKNTRNKDRSLKETGFLKTHELREAKLKICKIVQESEFEEDLSRLRTSKAPSHRLSALSPFLDKEGLIRVGGRLRNSNESFSMKHPILIPKAHHITKLIIDYYHIKHLHAGPRFLQSVISQSFWIISARSVIRSRVLKCIRCCRCKPKLATQKMGDLPPARVLPAKPFYNSGTDFMGPFLIKSGLLRKSTPIKAYICVFICFAVKAVHLEVVTSLTAEAFIAALSRFVARRGHIGNLFCDCGTNYVGAASEMKISQELFKQKTTKEAVDSFTSQNEIKFHFLPPASPQMGGLWERMVQSVKHHLRRVIGDQILSLEEFITLSTRVEAILNSRPLTALSSDPAEVDCLTPGHFLVGGPLVAPPEPEWRDTPLNRLSRWQLVQALTQSLWVRWKQEYLHTLQQRAKWRTAQANVKVGDLVLIHEPNSPPLSWKMGRITDTTAGADGLVRVVHLHTTKGPLTRPITKISPLPLSSE